MKMRHAFLRNTKSKMIVLKIISETYKTEILTINANIEF